MLLATMTAPDAAPRRAAHVVISAYLAAIVNRNSDPHPSVDRAHILPRDVRRSSCRSPARSRRQGIFPACATFGISRRFARTGRRECRCHCPARKKTQSPFSWLAVTFTSGFTPGRWNLIALPMRFWSNCTNCVESPVIVGSVPLVTDAPLSEIAALQLATACSKTPFISVGAD